MSEQKKRTVGPVTGAAALGGASATLIAWVLSVTLHLEMPEAVEMALAVIIAGGGSILAGWAVHPGGGDHV